MLDPRPRDASTQARVSGNAHNLTSRCTWNFALSKMSNYTHDLTQLPGYTLSNTRIKTYSKEVTNMSIMSIFWQLLTFFSSISTILTIVGTLLATIVFSSWNLH